MNPTEPIAVTTGYYGGQPTVRTLDKSLVLPVGLALYPQPAAQGDALDAARYRLVRRGQHWSVIDGLGNALRAEELDAAVDAARKQGANHDK